MEKFGTLGDVARRIRKLLEDACAVEHYLNDNNSQFARRTYIRSTFAYMEGTIWILKQLIIQVVSQSKAVTNPLQLLSLAELALLSDISYNLKENGEPYEQPKFLPMQKNLRLTVNVFNRLIHSSIDLQTNSTIWNRFNQIIQVRNRITHPKNVGDIDITDEEIQHAIEVCNWFNGISENCIEAFHNSFKK